MEQQTEIRVNAKELLDFVQTIFQTCGMSLDDAYLLADSLVKTLQQDVTRVVLPMAVALVVVLGLLFVAAPASDVGAQTECV